MKSGLAALRDIDPVYVGLGSWLCENSSARRARRNISKKLRTMESNRAARTMFGTFLENCIFYISQLYEFSHRLGHGLRTTPAGFARRSPGRMLRSASACAAG